MKTNELLPGDVFIQYNGTTPAHSLMYVGPKGVERSVCHAVRSRGKSGVIMGSLSSYSEKSTGEMDPEMSVYRCIRPEGLAAKAAEYAMRWTEKSVEGLSKADWERINKIKDNEPPHEFKTKFSDAKKCKAEMDTSDVAMTPNGVMKIAKAYASAADAGRVYALHPRNGVCCSQFIHYSFQAASIDLAVGGGELKVPDAFTGRNTFRIKNFTPLYDNGPDDIYKIWEKFIGAAPSKIIEPLRFDTSRTHVARLWDVLYNDAKSDDPHFRCVQCVGQSEFY